LPQGVSYVVTPLFISLHVTMIVWSEKAKFGFSHSTLMYKHTHAIGKIMGKN